MHRLMGGSPPEKIPNVALIGLDEPEEVASTAEGLVAEGYTGIRLKIGPGKDVECTAAVREAVGEDVSLRVDCNQGYGVADAVKMIRAIEPYDVELVEQPTVWWDFGSLAEVAAAVDTPIMPHESIFQLSDVKALIDLGAVGVLGLKTYRPVGGLTNARRLLDMAKIMGIPCLLHDDVELGVSLAAATHFIAARYRDLKYKAELSGFPEWIADDVVTPPLKIEGGYAEVPDGPGLGVELDEGKIERYSTGTITCR